MDHCVAILAALVCLSSPTFSRSYIGPDTFDGKHDYEFESWHPDGYEIDPSWVRFEYPKRTTPGFYSYDDSQETGVDLEHYQRYENDYRNDRKFNHGFHIGYPDRDSHHNRESYGNHDHRDYNLGQGHHYDNKHGNHERPGQNAGRSIWSQVNLGQSGGNTAFAQRGSPQRQNNQNGSTGGVDRVVVPGLRLPGVTTVTSPSEPESSTRRAAQAPSVIPWPLSATPSVMAMVNCVRSCPLLFEYEPVCGSNNFTYNNQQSLDCARKCGVNLTLSYHGPCDRPTEDISAEDLVKYARSISNLTGSESTTQNIQNAQNTETPTPTAPIASEPTRLITIDNPQESLDKLCSKVLEVLKRVFDNKPKANNSTTTTNTNSTNI